MYYNRTLSEEFARNLVQNNPLRWLFDYVKTHSDLDFQIGQNANEEWISVYRGLTRIVALKKTMKPNIVKLDTNKSYRNISPRLSGTMPIAEIDVEPIERVRLWLENKKKEYHYNNHKEGYYQNELSRMFGLCGNGEALFAIVDKEAVVGYKDTTEKELLFSPLQEQYKKLQRELSALDATHYGENLESRSIGKELDFLALNKAGDLMLIEYKHGTNTSGIYLSPLQIGLYIDTFSSLPRDEFLQDVAKMFLQKQEIGLINPEWKMPSLSGKIVPALIISEPNPQSTAKKKFRDVLDFCRQKRGDSFLEGLTTYDYTSEDGLTAWQ